MPRSIGHPVRDVPVERVARFADPAEPRGSNTLGRMAAAKDVDILPVLPLGR
jgi:hypothetical protein